MKCISSVVHSLKGKKNTPQTILLGTDNKFKTFQMRRRKNDHDAELCIVVRAEKFSTTIHVHAIGILKMCAQVVLSWRIIHIYQVNEYTYVVVSGETREYSKTAEKWKHPSHLKTPRVGRWILRALTCVYLHKWNVLNYVDKY